MDCLTCIMNDEGHCIEPGLYIEDVSKIKACLYWSERIVIKTNRTCTYCKNNYEGWCTEYKKNLVDLVIAKTMPLICIYWRLKNV